MNSQNKNSDNYLWCIAIVFIVTAVIFLGTTKTNSRKIIQHPLVNAVDYTKKPVRDASLKATMQYNNEPYSCNECHQTLEPSTIQKSFFSAHPDIHLDHGVNNYCTTCHSPSNRNMLVDINKEDVPFGQSQKTCLQCHGPIYRDWENGVHGRMNGYWNEDKGEKVKLTCVSCHDPHQPKFKSMKPAPAPQIENYRSFLKSITPKEQVHE